jgi:uncharacterized protein (TIGR03437 family)
MLNSQPSAGIRLLLMPLLLLPALLSCQLYSVQTFPVGHQPSGLAVSGPGPGSARQQYLAVANSGDNTVSIFQTQYSTGVGPTATLLQVASPYNVIPCGVVTGTGLLVTSAASTVTLIDPVGAAPLVINVGPQPYSASCSIGVFVSTFGDSALSMLNLQSGTVTLRIPNVPGSRSAQGILVTPGSLSNTPALVFVAGTDANVVTVVNVALAKAVASIPVPQPVALLSSGYNEKTAIAVVCANGSITYVDPSTLAVVGVGVASQLVPIISVVAGAGSLEVAGGSVVDTVFQGSSIQASFVVPGTSGAAQLAIFCDAQVVFPPCPGTFATLPGSDSVAFIVTLTGPSAASVTNAASFDKWAPAGGRPLPNGAVPGALATVFTLSQSGVAQQWAATLPLPTTLGGVSVAVGGTATYANSAWTYSSTGSVLAPLLYVSPTQINFQMPLGIQGELVPIQITYPNGTNLLTSVSAGTTDPGIFTLTSVPTGPGAVLNQDNSVNLGGNPAARGSVIQIFATGAGATTPSLASGSPAPASGSPLVFTQVQPTVTIGGRNAVVQFSGMAPGFVGVWQINAVVPQSAALGATVPLVVTAGGVASNAVTIAVR